jgi:hypothetical protein
MRDNLALHAALLVVALLFLKGLFGSVESRQGDCGIHRIDKDQSAVYLQFEKAQAHKNIRKVRKRLSISE